jgi:group I intron endonuclease
MKICGVYVIQNRITKDLYVGSSVDVESRKKRHLRELLNGTHHSKKLQRDVSLYGLRNFSFTVVALCKPHLLGVSEQYFINKWEPKYNVNKRVSGRVMKSVRDLQRTMA